MPNSTNQTTFVEAFKQLAPTTRFFLQLTMAVGGVSVLYYLGYLSFKGIGILTMILLSVSLIVMSLSGAETETRQAITDKFTAMWTVLKTSFADAMMAQKQQQTKTA